MKRAFPQNISIRFRRWSRASYAIFSSLACQISIGYLAANVSEKSVLKVASTSVALCQINYDGAEAERQQELSLEEFTAQIEKIFVLSFQTTSVAAAAGKNQLYILILKRLMWLSCYFNRFFLFKKL
ncbi:MAG: hypothetical protein AUK44_09720 [Porphyromonadaceae bacterium CG2_30_38_12]|nr:MAG: hypothetical protein AUK44_09720 [Porphyromonadaceae bacterium CG2_30_38_12]